MKKSQKKRIWIPAQKSGIKLKKPSSVIKRNQAFRHIFHCLLSVDSF